MKLKVEYLPIGDIKPYENNAKIHTPEQIEQIKTSIEQFGMNDPIGIWSKDNIIVEGHGRLLACQELGYKEVPVIRLDELTDEQRKAYTLIHNQTTLNSDFDYNILDSELAKIENIDMQLYEFEDIEVSEDDYDTEFTLNSDDKPQTRTIHLLLSERQYEIMQTAIDQISKEVEFEDNGSSNKYGNAVYEIIRDWRLNNDN